MTGILCKGVVILEGDTLFQRSCGLTAIADFPLGRNEIDGLPLGKRDIACGRQGQGGAGQVSAFRAGQRQHGVARLVR